MIDSPIFLDIRPIIVKTADWLRSKHELNSTELCEADAPIESKAPARFNLCNTQLNQAKLAQQCRAIWAICAIRKMPLIWCVRNQTPVEVIRHLLCEQAGFSLAWFKSKRMEYADMSLFAENLLILGNSPLWLCECPDANIFEATILHQAHENCLCYVACDWSLSRSERVAAIQLSKESELLFI